MGAESINIFLIILESIFLSLEGKIIALIDIWMYFSDLMTHCNELASLLQGGSLFYETDLSQRVIKFRI